LRSNCALNNLTTTSLIVSVGSTSMC
jgi:hypothetical protein